MMPSIIIFIEAAGALAHLAPEGRHVYQRATGALCLNRGSHG